MDLDYDVSFGHTFIKCRKNLCKKYIPTISEAVVEKVFLKISQNSQENTWARVSFLNKVAGFSMPVA